MNRWMDACRDASMNEWMNEWTNERARKMRCSRALGSNDYPNAWKTETKTSRPPQEAHHTLPWHHHPGCDLQRWIEYQEAQSHVGPLGTDRPPVARISGDIPDKSPGRWVGPQRTCRSPARRNVLKRCKTGWNNPRCLHTCAVNIDFETAVSRDWRVSGVVTPCAPSTNAPKSFENLYTDKKYNQFLGLGSDAILGGGNMAVLNVATSIWDYNNSIQDQVLGVSSYKVYQILEKK